MTGNEKPLDDFRANRNRQGAEIGELKMITALDRSRKRSSVHAQSASERCKRWIHNYPRWLRRVAAQASREGRIDYRGAGGSNYSALDSIRRLAPGLVDHWGAADGKLILEPYRTESDPETIADCQRVAEAYELDYSISNAKAEWNPGLTVRIEFWPRPILLESAIYPAFGIHSQLGANATL